jgi:CheY-like chemotaxis protein
VAVRPSPCDRELAQGSTLKFLVSKLSEGGATAPSPPGTETVLLVGDEPGVRSLARLPLQQGYAVVEAANGREALVMLARRRGPVHLLLTDVVIPEMSGREWAERLTAACPGLPVLLLSGCTEDEAIRDLVGAE